MSNLTWAFLTRPKLCILLLRSAVRLQRSSRPVFAIRPAPASIVHCRVATASLSDFLVCERSSLLFAFRVVCHPARSESISNNVETHSPSKHHYGEHEEEGRRHDVRHDARRAAAGPQGVPALRQRRCGPSWGSHIPLKHTS